MPLSRLDNFLKNVRGNIIYVSPNDLDATDSVDNQGNSMGRPFITIQRALIEASRFSYQAGLDNDRFGKTTILLSPGDHYVDNRPGWIPDGTDNYRLRDGSNSSDFSPFSSTSNFDLTTPTNVLYKLNSIYGGVIVPRGVSLVAQDLRKTKIRPYYVPNPENTSIERSAVFRVTGGCYFWQFTLLDGDPNGTVYKDYTTAKFAPSFSHNKLTCFEYADGVNAVDIKDDFNTYYTDRTDLDMYYEKVGLAYGAASGRAIEPDYPSSAIDIQPKVDEYRIVGPTGGEVGISSIKAGDGSTATVIVTATLSNAISGLGVDTRIQVNDVTDNDYNGSFPVDSVLTTDDIGTLSFTYSVPTVPTSALPSVAGATVSLDTDTVKSASPYIFNVSMRSTYGMCGLHADGSKATGFKSMLVGQFTGIGLQIDNNAFLKYNSATGTYDDSSTITNIHSDSRAIFKPSYTNYHLKVSNDAVLQAASAFAVGFAEHYVTQSGGDISITNSNSNFGQSALAASGFKKNAFTRDDVGYISYILPPKANTANDITLEYGSIDVGTTISVGSTTRLYLYGETNVATPPPSVIQGYRVGASDNELLRLQVPQGGNTTIQYAKIVMPDTQTGAVGIDGIKKSTVGRNVSTGNSISANTLTFTGDHSFLSGETVRVFSDNTRLPDGVKNNRIYYAITDGLNADQIQIAQSSKDVDNNNPLSVNNLGGTISIESRVSDKKSGETGHPIQFDTSQSKWYVNVSTAATCNTIYPTIVSLGTNSLGNATARTYITRKPDTRSLSDKTYRFLYVLPSGTGIGSARPPQENFIIQESNDVTGASDTEVSLQYSPTSVSMNNVSEMRNFSFIANAWHGSGVNYYDTELPHHLTVGSEVEINSVISVNNPIGVAQSGYNNTFTVTGITSTRQFTATSAVDPGLFQNNVSQRTTSLPTYKRKKLGNTYYVYDVEQVREYIAGEQDGVYFLTALDASNKPVITPYNVNNYAFSQSPTNLYPQLDRDNGNDNPKASISYALPNPIGEVVINDPKDSITRELVEQSYYDFQLGTGISDIVSNPTGTSHTITTPINHGLNRITKVSIASSGAGYGNGTGAVENLYGAALINGSGVDATARVTVDALGGVTGVEIMNGGVGFVAGDAVDVVSIATTTGFSQATLTVDNIYDNTGDTVKITGITSDTYQGYNQLYRITGISTYNKIEVTSNMEVSGRSIEGIGATVTAGASQFLTGATLNVSDLSYSSTTGLATVKTYQNHGFEVNNAVSLSGNTSQLYNGEFVVTENVGLTTFICKIGVTTSVVAYGGTVYAHPPGATAQGGDLTVYSDRFGGRSHARYAGITTALNNPVATTGIDQIEVENASRYDFKIGDFLKVNNEMMRIKTTVSKASNVIKVFRGVLGSQSATHITGSLVERVETTPIELRRPSFVRASGHTFEYLGYGPGNYSTALPALQDRQLSLREQLTAQSVPTDGGINVYNGINDTGDYYIGHKIVSANNGKEEVYDAPIPTVTGEDVFSLGIQAVDDISPVQVTVERTLTVEGGPDKNLISEFEGPVVFSKKVTSTSDEGIEAVSVSIQGDATISRKYTVGIAPPTIAGNVGDVTYNSDPVSGGELGWVYTTNNGWYPFGNVSVDTSRDIVLFDGVGIGTTSIAGIATDLNVKIGSGTSEVHVDVSGGVGIGTTNTKGYKLYVEGGVYGTFTGDGSQLTNLDSLWTEDPSETWIYTREPDDGGGGSRPFKDLKVGIGTSIGVYAQTHITGLAQTSLYVGNESRFIGTVNFEGPVSVAGTLTAASLDMESGNLNVGILTATQFHVGSGGTIISTPDNSSSVGVGIGTIAARAALDIEGDTRFKTYYEVPVDVAPTVSGISTVDLSKGQTFEVTTTSDITQFNILNPPSNSTSFTLKILQGSTAYGVGIDTFKSLAGIGLTVYWPGGVVPIVTQVADKTDIYSFMTFDGGNTFFGVVGGQNFS